MNQAVVIPNPSLLFFVVSFETPRFSVQRINVSYDFTTYKGTERSRNFSFLWNNRVEPDKKGLAVMQNIRQKDSFTGLCDNEAGVCGMGWG